MLTKNSSVFRVIPSTAHMRATRACVFKRHNLVMIILCSLIFSTPLMAANTSGIQTSADDKPDSILRLTMNREEMGKGLGSADRCIENTQCPQDSYCAKPIGQCLGAGECEDKPEICTQEYDPVCGCDGNTYSNACVAASVGINVDYLGECGEPSFVIE